MTPARVLQPSSPQHVVAVTPRWSNSGWWKPKRMPPRTPRPAEPDEPRRLHQSSELSWTPVQSRRGRRGHSFASPWVDGRRRGIYRAHSSLAPRRGGNSWRASGASVTRSTPHHPTLQRCWHSRSTRCVTASSVLPPTTAPPAETPSGASHVVAPGTGKLVAWHAACNTELLGHHPSFLSSCGVPSCVLLRWACTTP